MAGHLIYHWKHGWIPLTHAAALSKAHGSPHLADKYVPGASAHHTSVVTHGRSAREIHSTLTPHTHSTEGEVSKLRAGDHASVRGMDQFGRPMTFTGRVSGKPTPVRIKQGPNGAEHPHLAVSMHNGSDASGMDATARGTVYVKREAATHPDARVSVRAGTYNGETGHHITGTDTRGRQVKVFAPGDRAAADRAVANIKAGRGAFAHETPREQVPNGPFQQQQRRHVAAREQIQPSTADITAAAAQWKRDNPGKTLAGHEREVDRLAHDIAERKFVGTGVRSQNTPDEAAAERERARQSVVRDAAFRDAEAKRLAAEKAAPAEKRAQVEHSGDGTLLHLDRNDTEARAAAKAAGFKWSSNLGSWFLPRNWSEPTRRQKIAQLQGALGHDNVHLEDAGRGVTTTAAEREAEARARAADRAIHMDAKAQRLATEADVRFGRAKAIGDMIPFGQPILVGHHSESRHRRDLAKIDTNMRKGMEAHSEAQAAAAAAERARAATAGDSPLARQRRIDRKEAEVRKIDRALKDHELAQKLSATGRDPRRFGVYPSDPSHVEQMQANRAQLVDEIAHDKAQIAASGHQTIDRANVSAGDVIHYRGRAHVVSKVNQTTVSVPTGYSWDDKVPVNQITRHVKMADLSEASLRSAFTLAKSNPKLRATLLRELNRRGISAADL